eukprot:4658046-Pleurochrysis_carterae.AAC.2
MATLASLLALGWTAGANLAGPKHVASTSGLKMVADKVCILFAMPGCGNNVSPIPTAEQLSRRQAVWALKVSD